MSRDQQFHDQYSGSRQSSNPYNDQSPGLLSTPMSFTSAGNGSQYRDIANANYQPTLGQMADQFQERARAEARFGNPGSGGVAVQTFQENPTCDYYEFQGTDGGDGFEEDDNDGGGDGEDDPGLISAGNESTGRWTRAEHELFLQALKKYGKEWKKVASMVKTRTVVQTRTHAQKYFQKLTKTAPSSASFAPSRSSAEPVAQSSGSESAQKNSTIFYHKQQKQQRGGAMGSSSASKAEMMGSPPLSHMGHVQHGFRVSDDPQQSLHPSLLLPHSGVPQHLASSYIPTTHGYGELDPQDYYDGMDLVALVGELQKQQAATPQLQTPTNMSLNMPKIMTSAVGPPDFPEPSPAACGKRKHAELQAAQMLAASSTSKSRAPSSSAKNNGYSSASDFADALVSNNGGSAVKRETDPSRIVRDSSSDSAQGNNFTSRRNRLGLTLSIVDPAAEGVVGYSGGDPGTPWEAAIQHLEQQSASTAPMSRLMRSNSFSNYTMPAVPVATPSEQRNFLAKVRALVKDADLAGFASLLGAAEYSAQAVGMIKTESADGHGDDSEGHQHTPAQDEAKGGGASASNLMSAYTPDPAAGTVSDSAPDSNPDADGDGANTPQTAELRRKEALNTQFNSTSSLHDSSPRRPSASLVARSLNRIDRNSRSVLMDIAATSDPSINQTLLYSMCMLLIEHGASASIADGLGNTALHYAAKQGHERVGRLLLTKGCPLNAQNLEGDTATHLAARSGHVAFIEMLADLGANFHIRNAASMCALDLLGTNATEEQRRHLRKLMLTAEPRLRSLVLYHEDFQEHTARRPSDWEGPDRLEAIMKKLRDKDEFPEYEVEISNRFEKAHVELLGRVHSPEYIGFVNMLSKQVQQEASGKDSDIPGPPAVLPFTPQVQRFVRRQDSGELKQSESCDTSFSVGTLGAARRAAGAVAHGVDRVMLGRNRNVFCAVRPPGHHAGYRGLLDGANSCGFCIFNNVAAGALHALVEHQCERVAIIDLDVHHGNGTEDIVRRYAHPSRLFFFSLHLYDKDEPQANATQQQQQSSGGGTVKTTTDTPIDAVTTDAPTAKRVYEFYPGTGMKDDHIHNIINVPLTPLWAKDDALNMPSGQFIGREGYRQAIEQRLIPSLRAFNPTLILLSIGFDAAAGDVGNCRQFPGEAVSRMGIDLLPEDFAWATTEVMKIADICCHGRLVSVLEGGYGEYAPVKTSSAPAHAPTTRGASRNGGSAAGQSSSAGGTSATIPPPPTETKVQSALNRSLLGKVAAAHVHKLLDPYGPHPIHPPPK